MRRIRKKRRSGRLPGVLLLLLLFTVELCFCLLLAYTKFFQMKYMLFIMAVSVGFAGVIYWMLSDINRRIRFVAGCFFMTVVIVAEGTGSFYIYRTAAALDSVTDINTETTEINIYVKKTSDAESLIDIESGTTGILKELDRDHTDRVLQQLKYKTGVTFKTKEYPGLTELSEGLLSGECDAVILNQAYLEVMRQMEQCGTFLEESRVLDTEQIQDVIERKINTGNKTNDGSEPGQSTHVYTIYLSGIDTRGEMTASSLSDVNIILTVNTKTKQILLVSTPRDYYVPLSISGGVPDKLTHAGIYGVNVCIDTLEMLYNMEINYYFRINFAGFIKVIDALGGIEIQSDYEFNTQNARGYRFEKGSNYVNGEEALAFCRERYSFAEGDRQRGRNQMYVIRGILGKVMKGEFLKNYFSVLDSLENCFETNVPYSLVSDLVQEQIKDQAKWSVLFYSADGTGDNQKPYSMNQNAYVMIPDTDTVEKAELLMQKVRDDFLLSEADVAK